MIPFGVVEAGVEPLAALLPLGQVLEQEAAGETRMTAPSAISARRPAPKSFMS